MKILSPVQSPTRMGESFMTFRFSVRIKRTEERLARFRAGVERVGKQKRTSLGSDPILESVRVRVGIALEVPDEGDHRVVHLKNKDKSVESQRRVSFFPSLPGFLFFVPWISRA